MNIISEGKVRFYASVNTDGKISKELEVFYNPLMKFNRDVSVLLLNSLHELDNFEDISLADLMAGSGVRSIRFLKELNPKIIRGVFVNDYSEKFPELFRKNLELNDLSIDDLKKIHIFSSDANMFLLDNHGFDYIDIDPFGSPNDFLDNSITRISRNGILAVTATDISPLAGTHFNTCKRKYWARPLNNHLMHEVGLRILIRKIQLLGAHNDKALIPILAYSRDHYVRIFFKCNKGKLKVDEVLKKHQYFLYCDKCFSFKTSEYNHEICICKNQMSYYGPLWVGQMSRTNLLENMLKIASTQDTNKMSNADKNFLTVLLEESKCLQVGFYDIHILCKHLNKEISNYDKLIKKIQEKGYFAIRTSFNKYGIKTNIPSSELLKLI